MNRLSFRAFIINPYTVPLPLTSPMPAFPADAFVLRLHDRVLDCRPGGSHGAHVMGILNITPDSFSDGGAFMSADAALQRVEAMLQEGAAIIDIGGESTRPQGRTYGTGAMPVDEVQEQQRVLPIIEAVVQRFPEAVISIDTYKPAVARAALEAGAHLVNDVTGLRLFPETAGIAAAFRAPIVLMHALGRPGEMPHEHTYADVVSEVCASLQDSIAVAEAAGVGQVVLDPGFGFGKSPAENLQLLAGTPALLGLGHPVLVGLSRKSTIGVLLGTPNAPMPVAERLYGTLGATAVAVLRGASIVRTHDVGPTVQMLRLLGATACALSPEAAPA